MAITRIGSGGITRLPPPPTDPTRMALRDLFAEREKTTYVPPPPPQYPTFQGFTPAEQTTIDLSRGEEMGQILDAIQQPNLMGTPLLSPYGGISGLAQFMLDREAAEAASAAAPVIPGAGELPAATEDGYKMFKWGEEGYELAGGAAPDWWRAFVPEEVTPETAYGAMLNAMIPFISPEDQVRVAHSLYTMFDTELSRYKPGYIPEVSTVTEDQARYLMEQGRPVSGIWEGSQQKRLATGETITTRTSELEPLSDQMRRYFMSSQRATDAIQTLSNMREAMVQGNRWKLGPGYKWLQNIMGSVAGRGAGGETAQTRQQYLSMLGAVDPFLSQAGGGELQAFGPLGQMLTKPFFTAGQMMPQQSGRFGVPNRRFF